MAVETAQRADRGAAGRRSCALSAGASVPTQTSTPDGEGLLIIACGALAHEITALRRANRWDRLDVRCLPAELHNRPEKIPGAVRALIHASRANYRSIFVAYADCGTGGMLDKVLNEEGIERIPGAHCYEFFATAPVFSALAEAEPGTFYLTDFLLRHFERLVIKGLGLDRHPELFPSYFGNYRKLVYLAQAPAPHSEAQARAIAARLGLDFEYRHTGFGTLGSALSLPRSITAKRRCCARSGREFAHRHFLARHPGAGHREAGAAKRRRYSSRIDFRRLSTAPLCAPARAALTPTSPTGSEVRRAPVARICQPRPRRRPHGSRRSTPMRTSNG